MELIVIEIFLWVGLIFFFWALKDGLGNVEADIEDVRSLNSRTAIRPLTIRRYDQPEDVVEPIGSYKDQPIYRYAIIDGQIYQFSHICLFNICNSIPDEQRCVAPGLVYLPISQHDESQVMTGTKLSDGQNKSN